MSCCKDKDNPNANAEHACCNGKEKKSGCCCGGKCYCRCLLGGIARLFGCKAKSCCTDNNKCGDKACDCGCNQGKECTCDKNNVSYGCSVDKQKTGSRNDVVNAGKVLLGLLENQTKGLSPEQLVKQPGGVMNHPIWTMGHLCLTMDGVLMYLGHKPTLDDKWQKLFGGGSQPVADVNAYPSHTELHKTLVDLYTKATDAYLAAPSEVLRAQNPDEKRRMMGATVGAFVVFLLNAHLGVHIGQVSAWRRAMGLPPLF